MSIADDDFDPIHPATLVFPPDKSDCDPDLDLDSLIYYMKEDEKYSEIQMNPRAAFLPSRPALIKLIKIMASRLHLSQRTYFLAIHYMDDVMTGLAFPKSRLHLAALCCLFLAGNELAACQCEY